MNILPTRFAEIGPFLAKIELPAPTPSSGKLPSFVLSDLLLVLALSLVLAGVIIFWALFIRKPKDARTDPMKSHRPIILEEAKENDQKSRRRRRKKRRREHRARNPTLSETGGLPPTRTQESAEPLP